MDYLGKGGVLTKTDLDRFVNNMCFVYIEKVLDLCVQLMKNGGKSVAFIILFSVYIYIYILHAISNLNIGNY